MIAFVRKNLTFFVMKQNSLVCRSPISFLLSLHFFSTSKESQLCISPKVFDILLHKHDFSPELASRTASKLSHLKNPEEVDSIVSLFKESGFSNTQIEKIVKYRPSSLSASRIKPRIKIFQDTGFSPNDISYIISLNPAICHISVENNIIPSLSKLKDLFGSNNVVARVLRLSRRLLTSNLENAVVPNIEFLNNCGVPMGRIHFLLRTFPDSLLVKQDIVRKSAEKAKEMGFDGSSKMFIYAVRTFASMSNEAWELKLKAFKDLGFSESDILKMFRKTPGSFCVSLEKIKKVKEVLLATGKFNMSCIVNSPISLTQSVENRYIPRLQILAILESRNLIKDWPALSTISVLSDEKFLEKFVRPYLNLNEISDVYITKSSARSK